MTLLFQGWIMFISQIIKVLESMRSFLVDKYVGKSSELFDNQLPAD